MRPPRPAERFLMSLLGMLIGRLLVGIVKRWSSWREEADAMRWVKDLAYTTHDGKLKAYSFDANQHQYHRLDGYWSIYGPPSTAMEAEYLRRYGADNPELN